MVTCVRTVRDAESDPDRNSGTDPLPTAIRNDYEYDIVGNVTRHVDGRGIATDYEVNELNQVVKETKAAAHGVFISDPVGPLDLVDFAYETRYVYDANNNLVRHQVEDRGNTKDVGIQGDINGDNELNADDIDALYGLIGTTPNPKVDLLIDGVVDLLDVEFLSATSLAQSPVITTSMVSSIRQITTSGWGALVLPQLVWLPMAIAMASSISMTTRVESEYRSS